jgi:hypothetical protein
LGVIPLGHGTSFIRRFVRGVHGPFHPWKVFDLQRVAIPVQGVKSCSIHAIPPIRSRSASRQANVFASREELRPAHSRAGRCKLFVVHGEIAYSDFSQFARLKIFDVRHHEVIIAHRNEAIHHALENLFVIHI